MAEIQIKIMAMKKSAVSRAFYEVSKVIFYWALWNTPQDRVQIPHSVHFSLSMTGAPKPFWEMAPRGQSRTTGQGWFWGQ
jgi:hypothetical protein